MQQKRLNAKQKQFCKAYAAGLTASEAAKGAGYNMKYAYELLQNPRIQQHLHELALAYQIHVKEGLNEQIIRYRYMADKAMIYQQFSAAIKAMQRVDALLFMKQQAEVMAESLAQDGKESLPEPALAQEAGHAPETWSQ